MLYWDICCTKRYVILEGYVILRDMLYWDIWQRDILH